MFFLSFFSFAFPSLSEIGGLRRIHLITRYCHKSDQPPDMLYITDGGVQDCTGLLQLMKRRVPRILLVLADDDPEIKLVQLRRTMEMAMDQRMGPLGSFYDLTDPRRSYRMTLDNFARSGTYFKLGIRYGWDLECGVGQDQLGVLYVVKLRIPVNYDVRIPKYVTQKEVAPHLPVAGCEEEDVDPSWAGIRQTDLGGCCCDCCHLSGLNCGRKFPHIPSTTQCLTPQHFNGLCRLGREISREAVDTLRESLAANGARRQQSSVRR